MLLPDSRIWVVGHAVMNRLEHRYVPCESPIEIIRGQHGDVDWHFPHRGGLQSLERPTQVNERQIIVIGSCRLAEVSCALRRHKEPNCRDPLFKPICMNQRIPKETFRVLQVVMCEETSREYCPEEHVCPGETVVEICREFTQAVHFHVATLRPTNRLD